MCSFTAARRDERQLTGDGIRTAADAQALDLVAKRFHVLEAAIDGSEAHVGDLVEMAELVHHELAHESRRDFPFAEAAQAVRDVLDGGIDGIGTDRALLQALHHAATQFLLVEGHAAAILLHHLRQHQFSGLEGGETLTALQALVEDDSYVGPVNLTGPDPVTNAEVTATMGRVLGRPTILPAPAFALKAVLGEFSTEVLGSSRVMPEVLESHGFPFADRTIESAIRAALAEGS